MGGKRGRVLLALGGSLSLAALYVAYTRLQRKSTRRTKGAENGPAGLEVEPLEREEVGRKAFVHGSPESASPENARSRHHRVLSKWSEEQARSATRAYYARRILDVRGLDRAKKGVTRVPGR